MDLLKANNVLVNSLLFPGMYARSTYSLEQYNSNKKYGEEPQIKDPKLKLLFIPFFAPYVCWSNCFNAPSHIPGLLQVGDSNNASIFVIHFHGNACDCGQIEICAQREGYSLNAHYLLIEYPRYLTTYLSI